MDKSEVVSTYWRAHSWRLWERPLCRAYLTWTQARDQWTLSACALGNGWAHTWQFSAGFAWVCCPSGRRACCRPAPDTARCSRTRSRRTPTRPVTQPTAGHTSYTHTNTYSRFWFLRNFSDFVFRKNSYPIFDEFSPLANSSQTEMPRGKINQPNTSIVTGVRNFKTA